MPIPEAVFSARVEPADKPGWVVRPAEMIFPAGTHTFTEAEGGNFTMTPQEIERLCADFSRPVELEDTHHPSIFNGKLGHLVQVKSNNKGQSFGGKIRIPRWLHNLFPNEPIKVSARFDRATKRLTKLALVPNPRIEGAAAFSKSAGFANFAASMDPGYNAEGDSANNNPDPPIPGKPDNENQTSEIGRQTAQQIAEILTNAVNTPGLNEHEKQMFGEMLAHCQSCCGVTPGDVDGAGGGASQYTPTTPEAMMSQTERDLAQRLKRMEEAFFAQEKAQWEKDAVAFVEKQINAKKLLTREGMGVYRRYLQAKKDDRAHPAEVVFSASDGTERKGTRLAALEAEFAARPQHNLFEEVAGDGNGTQTGEVLFNRMATPDASKPAGPMSPERKAKLQSYSPTGRQIAKEAKAKAS